MEVRCPACTRQLSVPQSAPGTALKCPYCGSVFQLAAPAAAPQPAAVGYGPPPVPGFAPPGLPSAPQASFGESGPIVTTHYRRRPRNSDQGLKIAMVMLFVAVVGGLIGAGVWMSRNSRDRTVVASPTDAVRQKAHEFVNQEMKYPAGTVYPDEEKVEKLPNNRWRISSFVDVPSRVGSVYLRQKWNAQLTKAPDGGWKLDRLEVDGEVVSPKVGQRERPQQVGERSRWLTGNDGDGGGAGNRFAASGPDRSTRWAVDKVTSEIKESAKLRKTLVVWLLDRSASARSQQQDFLHHVDGALNEMKGNKADDPQLSMAVVAFGEEVEFPLETPSGDPAEVRQALQSISEDTSGKESTFAALTQAAEKFGSFRAEKSGYVIFVVVSDETGDDVGQLDATVALMKQQQITVHTIGVSAPFGLAVADAQKSLEANGQVRQGPESRYSEMINLASMGSNSAIELDSGFGPFSLSRLCQESGGQYLACKDFGVAAGSRSEAWGGGASGRPDFDPALLRKYAPDYVSEEEYKQILASNKACQALHEAAKLPFAEVLGSVTTSFTKRDEASFKRSLDTAQQAAAKFEQRLIALHETLRKGEADRAKLTRPRWQAAYDLALGRAAAARCRTEGYNAMLAKIKTGGNFTKPGANTWVLNESDTIGAGSTFEKMLTQSRDCLERVVKDHPGTPWAYLAERELQHNAGWQWSEQ